MSVGLAMIIRVKSKSPLDEVAVSSWERVFDRHAFSLGSLQ